MGRTPILPDSAFLRRDLEDLSRICSGLFAGGIFGLSGSRTLAWKAA
jgi:hypothetical protein